MDMTIKDVKVWPAYIPNTMNVGKVSATASISCVVIEITTADGIKGHGITSITDEEAVVAILRDLVAPNIKGLNALDREKVAETLYWLLTPRGQTGYATHAISAVDIALWDILGKATGLPCWQLIGGARRSVPLYVTFGFGAFDRDQLVEAARHLRSEGVTRFKMVVGHHALAKRNKGADIGAILREDMVRVRLVREAIGEENELYIDANCSLNEGSARKLLDGLRDVGITFFEEPMRDNDPRAMRELRRQTGIRIAAGQNEGQLWRFSSLIREQAVDVLQPNAVICGGLTAAIKVAALAQANNVDIANGGAFTFHNLHLHAGLANGGLVEWHLAAIELCRAVFDGLPDKNGDMLECSDRPGLGFDLNYDALEDLPAVRWRKATARDEVGYTGRRCRGGRRMTTMRANEGTSRTVDLADDEAVPANAESTSSPFDEAVQFGILEELVGFHLRLADDRTFENFARGLGPDRLRPGCFTMLTLIVNNPGITQITLSRASGRDKSSVTKDLRYMEDAGLIRRVRLSEDRRSYASFVTQEGAELSERLTREVKAHSTRLTSIIGEDRKALLLAILKDLINNLPESRNSAARD